jgi:hypothetical protein
VSGVILGRMRGRASAIVGGRRARAVFVVTLGLGILAIVLSDKHSHHSTFWGIIGVVGFVLVIVSLPSQFYDMRRRYLLSRRGESG